MFFWCGNENSRKISMIKWDTICLDKDKCNLRVKRIEEFNMVVSEVVLESAGGAVEFLV